MVTTLIEWDTMSCSSRAIRVRSSWAIAGGLLLALGLEPVGAGDGLLGPASARSRVTMPTVHGPAKNTRAAARSLGSKPSTMLTPMNGTSTIARPAYDRGGRVS